MQLQEIEQSICDALKDGPIDDVLAWLISRLDGRTNDVLQAYGRVIAGNFGHVESAGHDENAYSCGAKTLRAYPQKLTAH